MARFHINPTTGDPGPCRARKSCPFGDMETEHYDSLEAAQAAFEASQAPKSLASHSKNIPLTPALLQRVELMSYEEMEEYMATSPQHHTLMDKVIEARAEEAKNWGERLAEIDPFKHPDSSCDKTTFKNLKREFNEYKDQTAMLVEAHLQSPHYSPLYENRDWDQVGTAVMVTTHEPNTREWLEARYDSVGGSDVANLVVMDHADPDSIMYWDRKAMESTEKSKLQLPTDEEVAKRSHLSFESRGGALYRGTMWEDRSRDQFVKDHPDLKVYNTKHQYANSRRPWQQVNFDGLLSDRADGVPNGILELKTSNDPDKWTAGPPLNYRAQVLYYLNATGLDYAKIGVNLNDGEFRYYTLHRNDAVAPGKYDKPMETYIQERVDPWFTGLKARRSAA